MEQQTVSIAKAGITTTLNNEQPCWRQQIAFGRYDIRRSPAENINLPAALLSRFDLLWLIWTVRAWRQICHSHSMCYQFTGKDELQCEKLPYSALSADMLRAYIAAAKQYSPFCAFCIVRICCLSVCRTQSRRGCCRGPTPYTTARTLLSILRLSQALARLRFSDEVEQSDVDEALRLMKMSKASLYDEGETDRAPDPVSQIFSRIRVHAERTRRSAYSWADLMDLLGTSFKPDQIKQCLQDYASINVWQLEGGTEDNPGIRLTVS
eukprot:jgi/Picre1/29293/NNA_004685.t1